MPTRRSKTIVFVMMSGGVDSSVAAFLLQKQGHKVIGCFIKGYNVDGCQEKDAEDARRVAEHLNIPFYTIDLEKEYKKLVVDYTVRSYKEGLTPNPDVMCNKEIKFGLFFKKALDLGAPACRQTGIYVATGHYVRLVERKNFLPSTRFAYPATRSLVLAEKPSTPRLRSGLITTDPAFSAAGVSENKIFSLLAAKDKNKDQSYFLWTLTQEQLKHCLFPIGDYKKPEIRRIAKKAGLPTADKKDSQGICFLGQISMEEFLKKYIPAKKGAVLNMEDKKIGEHKGVYFYTVGQRHGIGISGKKPYYVAEKYYKTNVIKVAEGDDQSLYKKEAYLKSVNWTSGKLPKEKISVLARLRYRQPLFEADFYPGFGRLEFKKPQKFVAPGQSAVLYNKRGEMLGGGIIV